MSSRKILKLLILGITCLAILFGNVTAVFATQGIVEAVQHYYPIIDLKTYEPFMDGNITYEELLKEVEPQLKDEKTDFKAWDLLITQKGINHIDDKLLDEFIKNVPIELTKTYNQYQEALDKNPTATQIEQIAATQSRLEAQKTPLSASLASTKEAITAVAEKDAKTAKPIFTAEQTAVIQEAANAVAAIDGKIDTLIQPLRIPDDIKECERFIASAKEKFICAVKEQEFREQKLVEREYVHSTYYMDFTAHSGHLTGTVTFTNASATVTGDGSTLFTTEIANNDYIRQSDGTQWYKVTARAANNSCTITPAFQQATHTDDAGTSFLSASATQDGTTTSKAFPHLNRYTTDTARTAGDILKVRANQTNVIAGINITFDESGTVTQYDEIRGCSVADDPFSDASNVQPIFDFGNTTFQISVQVDYWRYYNLTVTNNNKSNEGLVKLGTAKNPILDTCTIFLNNNAGGYGVYCTSVTTFPKFILNCTIYSNKGTNIWVEDTYCIVKGCTINGGAATTDYGIVLTLSLASGKCEVENTTIGSTTTHDISSISIALGGLMTMRYCVLADTTEAAVYRFFDIVTSEDHDQVLGAHSALYRSGTVTKCATGLTDTTVRAGGGTSSALMLPSSVVTIKYPLNLAYGSLTPDFAVWCPASETTVTVYMRPYTIWATYPTAAQCFIQADYYAGATALRSQSTASTQTLIDNREPAGAGTYTADATTDTTHVVDAGLAGTAYIGKYLYNATRSAGAEITGYVNGTKTITLGTAIAAQTTGDTYYIIDWVGFTTTFTPGTAGFAYLKVNLGLYAVGKGIRVDVKPVVS